MMYELPVTSHCRGFTRPDYSKPFFTEDYLAGLVLAIDPGNGVGNAPNVVPDCDHEYELRPGTASSEPRAGIYLCRKCGRDFVEGNAPKAEPSNVSPSKVAVAVLDV